MKKNPKTKHFMVPIAVLGLALLAFACAKPKGSDPDFVVFATGSLYGQLHTCG